MLSFQSWALCLCASHGPMSEGCRAAVKARGGCLGLLEQPSTRGRWENLTMKHPLFLFLDFTEKNP